MVEKKSKRTAADPLFRVMSTDELLAFITGGAGASKPDPIGVFLRALEEKKANTKKSAEEEEMERRIEASATLAIDAAEFLIERAAGDKSVLLAAAAGLCGKLVRVVARDERDRQALEDILHGAIVLACDPDLD